MKQLTILILMITTFAGSTIAQTDDRAAAIATVDALWEAMRTKSADGIKAVFTPGGQLIAIDKPRDGKGISTTRVLTGDAFAKMISEAKAPEFVEKMPSPEARVSGDLAVVSGRYTFWVGGKFSHCGSNTFNLVRTEQGWKIANAASTLEFQCERDLAAVVVPAIKADPADVATLDGIIKAFYESITGPKGTPRQWSRDRSLYSPDVRFVAMSEDGGKPRYSVATHQQFVDRSNAGLVAGGFTEREIHRVTRRFGNTAHVYSTYEFSDDAGTDKGRGVNSLHLIWDGTRWFITHAQWDDERPNNPIPKEFLPKGKK